MRGFFYELSPRSYSNESERQFIEQALKKGWIVTRKGWPDYLCVKTDPLTKKESLVLVEVKRSKKDKPRKEQLKVMRLLAAYGVPCYVWSPDGRIEQIK